MNMESDIRVEFGLILDKVRMENIGLRSMIHESFQNTRMEFARIMEEIRREEEDARRAKRSYDRQLMEIMRNQK